MAEQTTQARKPTVQILVAGDVCLDVVGVPMPERNRDPHAENWQMVGETRTHFLPGGAMLLTEFVKEAAAVTAATADSRIVEGPSPILPDDLTAPAKGPLSATEFLKHAERLTRGEVVHSLLELAPFAKSAKKGDKQKTLRVKAPHGYSGPATGDPPTLKFGYKSFPKEAAQVVVLDDTGNHFRKKSSPQTPWPKEINDPPTSAAEAPLVIYKLLRPLPSDKSPNDLWNHIERYFAATRIVVLNVDDLREAGFPISFGLSWERTAMDLMWNLFHDDRLKPLKACRRLIVRLGSSGALYWRRPWTTTTPPDCDSPDFRASGWLVYDPLEIEGSFSAKFDNLGSMVGQGSAFTAAIAGCVAESFQDLGTTDENADIDIEAEILAGVRLGLRAARRVLEHGYGDPGKLGNAPPTYPTKTSFAADKDDKQAFAHIQIPFIPTAQEPDRAYWRILDSVFERSRDDLHRAVAIVAREKKVEHELPLDADARTAKEASADARSKWKLSRAPLAVFADDLRTYDRREIESYRSLYTLLRSYTKLRDPERPLSVAVFGPPGSGKSFGVKQVAKALNQQNPQREIIALTYNLSQYHSTDELANAFHRVRDEVLRGKIPLVFFDEFDASIGDERLAWLKYFLAPMQDNTFLDRGADHPIGQSIFVFAGGTCSSFQEFADSPSLSRSEFRAAKGPDFLSRLRGVLDIPSLDFCLARESLLRLEAGRVRRKMLPGTFDPYGPVEFFPCRSAILLRRAQILAHQLKKKAKSLLNGAEELRISDEVLRALLWLPTFHHGTRSFEAMLDMSRLHDAKNFTAATLPPDAQQSIHVNARHLRQILETEISLPHDDREALAEKIHRNYLAKHPENADPKAMLAWDDNEFPDHLRDSNREQVDDIVDKLRAVNLWFRKVPRDHKPDVPWMVSVIRKHLTQLAHLEHDRWAAQKRRQGWAPGRDNTKDSKVTERLLHNCLFRWDELTETQQTLDHDAILAIPELLASISYEIIET